MTAPFDPAGQSGFTTTQTSRPARPDSISIASELWIVVILGQVIAFLAQYPTFSDEARRRVAEMGKDAPREQVEVLSSTSLLIATFVVSAVGLALVSGIVVWLTRSGYTWARVVLAGAGFYLTLTMIMALIRPISPTWAMVPLLLSGVAAVGASVLLMRRDADKYCRDMAVFRRESRPTFQYAAPQDYGTPGYPSHVYPGQQHPGAGYPHPHYPPQGGVPSSDTTPAVSPVRSPGDDNRRDQPEEGSGSGGHS